MSFMSRVSEKGLIAFIVRTHTGEEIAELIEGMEDEVQKLHPEGGGVTLDYVKNFREHLVKAMPDEKVEEYALYHLREIRRIRFESEVDNLLDDVYKKYLK